MKKLVAISVLFALLTGAAFAQVTFSGGVNTGIAMGFSSVEGEDPIIFTGHAFDLFDARVDLNGAFTHESGNAGGNFQLRAEYGFTGTGSLDLRNAWLWFQPMDMLYISLGRLDGDGFGTPSVIDASNGVGGNIGLHFRLTPIDGLRVGFTLNTEQDGEFGTMGMGIGFDYTMADTFRAVANVGIADLGADYKTGMDMAFGVSILALADMGFSEISVDVGLGGLGIENKDAEVAIGQRLKFETGDLAVTQQLRVDLGGKGNANIPEEKMAMRVGLEATYKINDITAGIGFGLGVNRFGSEDPRWWDGTGGDFVEKAMTLVINPFVKFPLAGPEITIGYGANVSIPEKGDNTINSGIYLLAGISF